MHMTLNGRFTRHSGFVGSANLADCAGKPPVIQITKCFRNIRLSINIIVLHYKIITI